jgi:hypothetical protein
VGAVGALGVAYALSARYPIGVGRRYEPDPGAHFDVTVLGLGFVAMLVVVVAGAVGLGVIQVRARARRASGARSSKLVAAAAASGAPIPLALGARLALERGHGRAAVPVRPALIGAIVGVLGIVGTFTFHDGLDRAATDRALYGQRFDAFGGVLGGTALDPAIIDGLTADADVEMVQEIRDGVVLINGMNVPALGIRTVKGNEGLAARHGRLPSNDQEISLAPGELKALGVAVGDRVEVGADQVQMTVVGEAFNPELIHTDYDHGARFTDAGLRRFLSSDDDLKFHLFTLRLVRGVDAAATIERLNATVPEAGLDAPMPSETQLNLRGVRRVPVALGAFLALLAIAAVGHALATAVRRRRHDVAVLRVLGLTRTQARACVAWQATILAVIGIMIGAPLGIALGRTTWRVVADSTPMFYVAPLAAVALALVGPLAILIANALAAWPGRFAAQVRPAEVLRAE